MKKLIVAAFLAGSMVAMADATAVATTEKAASAAAVEQPAKPLKRGPLTNEQRAEMRARREKMMAERKMQMEKKALEVIKKYGLDDEKAKALLNELQEAMRPVRRPRPVKPVAATPAPKAE